MAAQRDETAHLTARERKARESAKLCILIASTRPLLDISIGRPLRIGLDRHWSADLDFPPRLRASLNADALGSWTQTSKRGNRIPEVTHKSGSG
jgi:hypothetical protein